MDARGKSGMWVPPGGGEEEVGVVGNGWRRVSVSVT